MNRIKICGTPYKIKQVDVIDENIEGVTQGKTIYSQAKILICKRLPKRVKKRVLYHEVLHGILVELGYTELTCDETFVQGLSNALYQMFRLRNEN